MSRDINLKSKFYNDLNFIINRAEINKINFEVGRSSCRFFCRNFYEKKIILFSLLYDVLLKSCRKGRCENNLEKIGRLKVVKRER